MEMRVAHAILVAAIIVTLSAYAIDCGVMTAPEQAMQCCKSMPCHSHGHGSQDCCKTMPAMHAPFVQASISHDVSQPRAELGTVSTATAGLTIANPSERIVPALSHAPPILSSAASTPLRI